MKKIFQLIAFVLLMSPVSYAQTPLSQGDIAFIGLNLDLTDEHVFILLKDIDASTAISFTDQGWSDGGGGFQNFSGDASWTWTSGVPLTCGTVVTIATNAPGFTASIGSVIGTSPTVSNIGDQLFAFTGTISSPNIIAGIHSNIVAATTNDANWDGSSSTNQTSALPDVLTNGLNAIRLHVSETEIDNWRYNCAVVSGPVATVRAAINNIANWISNDITPFSPAAPPCTWAVTCASPCNNPNVPTVTPSLSLVTPGGSSTLNISGSLNDATQWAIYTGSCGGTLLGTTTTSSFVVNPSVTTSYFVRGEGGCVVPGSCGPATITVSTSTPTTLTQGDLAFIGVNHDGVDDYAFILLKDISDVTSISFTDHGWDDGTGFSNHAGDAVWTWTSGAALTCGTVVTISLSPSLTASIGSVSGALPIVSNIGDQIFAFQGSTASPTLIAGIHSNIEPSITDNANWDGSSTNNATSALPNVLTNGVNAIRLHSSEVEHDNWRYNCAVVSGSSTTVRAAINNISNWTSDDINPFTPIAPTCAWSVVCCTEPTIPVVTANPSTVCPGGSSTLTITGSLNDATQWAIYSGSCGGTLLGITTTSTFVVNPVANTTYFVRGLGACTTPALCGSVVVNVSDLALSSVSQTNVSCSGGSNGAASVNPATGGAGGYNYDWTGNPIGDGTISVSGLTSGVWICTVTDANSCTATQSFTIGTDPDLIPPTAVCQNLNVYVNASGNASIVAADIDGGSNDNCGPVTLSASSTTFSCADIGTNIPVTLTVTDGNGNSATCVASVTVLDTISPVVSCTNATVYLDGTGSAAVTPGDFTVSTPTTLYYTLTNSNTVYSASTDGSGTPIQLFSPAASGSLGPVGIVYRASSDSLYWGGGNLTEINTGPASGGTYSSLPNANVCCEHHDLEIDEANNRYFFTTNNFGVYVANINGSGVATSLNFGIDNSTVEYDPTTQRVFSNSVGGNLIVAANDNGTNSATLYSSANGVSGPRGLALKESTGTLYWTNRNSGTISSGSTDGTAPATPLYTGRNGLYHIVYEPSNDRLYWTEFDNSASGRILSAPANGSGPVVTLYSGISGGIRGITLGASSGGAIDNCGIPTLTLSPSAFNCTNVGTPMSVTITATDASGNSSTCVSTVTVLDTISPTAVCTPFTVNLNASGNGTLTAANIDGGSSDNCGTVTLSASQTAFTCAHIGTANVTLTVTDGSGNTSTCVAVVTVVGGPPVTGTDIIISCNPITWINGVTYAASNNTATHTIVGGAANGCDSLVTLNFTLLLAATGIDVQSACGTFTWINGVTYTASNSTATHTITGGAANGCDSIVTLNLTITIAGQVMNVGATNITTTSAEITWDPLPLPLTGSFAVEYREIGSTPWILGITASSVSTSAILSGLLSGANYEVKVTASCVNGQPGTPSTSHFFSTTSLACNSPIGMNIIDNNGNAITVSWTPIPGAGWYEFRFKPSASATWTSAGTLGGAATMKIFSGLLPNTSYDFESRTFCPNATVGAWSTTLTITTNGLAGCSLPPALVASIVTGANVTITWTTIPTAAYYAFRYKEASSATWISGGTAGPTATSKPYSGLSPNTLYDFEGRTICANGVSSTWGAITFTTAALSGCELPPILAATAVSTASSITISWGTVAGGAWYSFQYKPNSASTWINGGTAGPAVTAKTYGGLSAGTSYDFQVRTHCPNGVASAWSAPGTYSTNPSAPSMTTTTDKADQDVVDKALAGLAHVTTVYPNPALEKVNIDIFMDVASENTTIQLMDMSGRLVREAIVSGKKGVNTLTVDVQELSSGMYTLFVYQNGNLLNTSKVKKN